MLDLLLIAALRAWFARPEAEAPSWSRANGDPIVGLNRHGRDIQKFVPNGSGGYLVVTSPGPSMLRTIFGEKNAHSFFVCLPGIRAGMFSRHSHAVVVSKDRQLPQVWRSAPNFAHVSSWVRSPRLWRSCPH